MDFWKFYNWQMLCWVEISLFTKQHISIFHLISYGLFRILVILQNPNKLKYQI